MKSVTGNKLDRLQFTLRGAAFLRTLRMRGMLCAPDYHYPLSTFTPPTTPIIYFGIAHRVMQKIYGYYTTLLLKLTQRKKLLQIANFIHRFQLNFIFHFSIFLRLLVILLISSVEGEDTRISFAISMEMNQSLFDFQ